MGQEANGDQSDSTHVLPGHASSHLLAPLWCLGNRDRPLPEHSAPVLNSPLWGLPSSGPEQSEHSISR